MDEAALLTYDNMIKLNNLNEPVILHNLRQRFLKDSIYTYVSSILVALNPFKLLPIYTPEIMDKYKDGGGRTQPPHIFAVSDNAYRNLMADFRDQAVVISGESGAGKTETMKLVLQFLADVSGRAQKHSANGEKQESLEQQVLKSNPVMEAFGNAKTTRNNNSSRFGKWTEIKFNRTGAIVGGSIINYLLEKSRIPFQAQQERNYHIFYQLLAGGELDPALKKALKLRDAEEFRYMNQSGVTTVDSINDEKDWIEMTGAMDVLNMTTEEKEQVFRLVAGCLQLGNVDFERDPKGQEETDARVKNAEQNAIAAELLRVPAADLDKCLTYRKITRPGSKSITYAHYSLSKAKVRAAQWCAGRGLWEGTRAGPPRWTRLAHLDSPPPASPLVPPPRPCRTRATRAPRRCTASCSTGSSRRSTARSWAWWRSTRARTTSPPSVRAAAAGWLAGTEDEGEAALYGYAHAARSRYRVPHYACLLPLTLAPPQVCWTSSASSRSRPTRLSSCASTTVTRSSSSTSTSTSSASSRCVWLEGVHHSCWWFWRRACCARRVCSVSV
jgi:ABC-type oligopeptide transport system ATPase subunit